MEIVKKIEGLYGYYVSNTGRVFSTRRGNLIEMRQQHHNSGKRFGGKRYMTVKIYGKHHRVHRLVAKAFLTNFFDKPDVNHKDGNPLNNHVDNLEWVTNEENTRHALETGLITKAERKHGYDVVISIQFTNNGFVKRFYPDASTYDKGLKRVVTRLAQEGLELHSHYRVV